MLKTPSTDNKFRVFVIALAVLAASLGAADKPAGSMHFTVSMDRPDTHYFHVVFRSEGLKGETQDFKMPAWTPGFYQIMDYARNVLNFRAEDEAGRPLAWEKTAKNAWRVRCGRAAAVVVSYDVYAFTRFVAESFLDDSQAFITPASVFMHVGGALRHPAVVTIKPFPGWSRISTGLDPVPNRPATFAAPDFDVLYDSPILIGNQEVLPFEVSGTPHEFVGCGLGAFDRERFVSDLKKIIEASARLMGELPYQRYVFISIGEGRGGLEHSNSAALSFDAADLGTPDGYKRWLSFVCHEYFHAFNVKRIRPAALGPFDYDRENYTHMLWVSEGLTVYYEGLLLNRAGLFSREDVFELLQSSIQSYENSSGSLFQSAAASSFDTWLQSFQRSGNAANTTISYYDKGAGLGLLLDLKIRHESKNKKSLDDVMRHLYRTYHLERNRGWTDMEFRQACEAAAGASLAEIFEVYAVTTTAVDYPKYLAYAGLSIDVEPKDMPGAWLGAEVRTQNGRTTVTNVEWDSPASRAGLSIGDEVIALDGARTGPQSLDEILAGLKTGPAVKVLISRRGAVREMEAVLGKKTSRSFAIAPLSEPTPLQAAILADWIK